MTKQFFSRKVAFKNRIRAGINLRHFVSAYRHRQMKNHR